MLFILIVGSLIGDFIRVLCVILLDAKSLYFEPLLIPQIFGCFLNGLFSFYIEKLNFIVTEETSANETNVENNVETTSFKSADAQQSLQLLKFLNLSICGSMTTYSSWQSAVFGNWASGKDAIGYQIINGFFCILLTLLVGFASRDFGFFIAKLFNKTPDNTEDEDIALNILLTENSKENGENQLPKAVKTNLLTSLCLNHMKILDATSSLIWIGIIITTFLLIFLSQITSSWISVMISLSVAPIGTMIRYRLSIFNLSSFSIRPLTGVLGTFISNQLGTLLSAILNLILLLDPKNAFIYTGLNFGLCGCMTTLSTLIDEVKRSRNISYMIISVIISQIIFIFIDGIYLWTHS